MASNSIAVLITRYARPVMNGQRLTWIVVAAVLAYVAISALLTPRVENLYEWHCNSCDMAVWRALQMQLDTPELFARDQIFALQLPLFPTAFAHGLNALTDLTGHRQSAEQLASFLLAATFIIGLALLSLAVTRDAIASALIVLLAAASERFEISFGIIWGLPGLKPQGVIAALAPGLLWLLFLAARGRLHLAVFAVATASAIYVHPPMGLKLLGVGFLTYLLIQPFDSRRWLTIALGTAAAAIVLLPFLLGNTGSALESGAPMSVLEERVAYALFPYYTTLMWFFIYMLFPLVFCLWAAPRVWPLLEPVSRRFLVSLLFASFFVTSLAATAYMNTGFVKFMFHGATLFAYFPIFAGIALAVRHWKLFRVPGRATLAAGLLILVSHFDTYAVSEAENLKNEFQATGEIDLEAVGRSFGRLTATLLPDQTAQEQSIDDNLEGPNELRDLASAGTWIDEHTPIDTLVLIPPRDVDAGFRVLSRRASVVVDKDGGNVKYSASIAREWTERISAARDAYDSGTWEALLTTAREYNAELVLVPRQIPVPDAEVLFSNASWIVARTTPFPL